MISLYSSRFPNSSNLAQLFSAGIRHVPTHGQTLKQNIQKLILTLVMEVFNVLVFIEVFLRNVKRSKDKMYAGLLYFDRLKLLLLGNYDAILN